MNAPVSAMLHFPCHHVSSTTEHHRSNIIQTRIAQTSKQQPSIQTMECKTPKVASRTTQGSQLSINELYYST
jgi:hypothetical protein